MINKRYYILFLLILIIGSITFQFCKKSELSPYCWGKCEEGTFYYRGNKCASINGVICLDNGKCYVTQDKIPKEFRKDSIRVCIRYKKNLKSRGLTADCEQGEAIKIKCWKAK